MTKVVYNRCYGGFGLSNEAKARYKELTGKEIKKYNNNRHDPALVQVVEELGDKANGCSASLAIAVIEDGAKYRIDEYDGFESVMTPDDYEWVQT
jgi:hypothetical protein